MSYIDGMGLEIGSEIARKFANGVNTGNTVKRRFGNLFYYTSALLICVNLLALMHHLSMSTLLLSSLGAKRS